MKQKRCVYHVEDNEADRILVALALDAQGVPLELHAAIDGEQAIRMLTEDPAGERCHPPDLIVLDLNLPKLSGIEVLANMRARPALRSVPVVILTSSDSPQDRQQTEELGITAYLKKPMGLDGFMEIGGELFRLLEQGT